jgi:hypothetical protein
LCHAMNAVTRPQSARMTSAMSKPVRRRVVANARRLRKRR